jgi:hypothetical protein
MIATLRADCSSSCVPGPASCRRSEGLAMRWQGHVSVPGVSPEREVRLTAYLPASVVQRRDPAPYRSRAERWMSIDPALCCRRERSVRLHQKGRRRGRPRHGSLVANAATTYWRRRYSAGSVGTGARLGSCEVLRAGTPRRSGWSWSRTRSRAWSASGNGIPPRGALGGMGGCGGSISPPSAPSPDGPDEEPGAQNNAGTNMIARIT